MTSVLLLTLHLLDLEHDALRFAVVEHFVAPSLDDVLAGAATFVHDFVLFLLLCLIHQGLEKEVYSL